MQARNAHGIAKTIGDAFLVEFNSALEAAQCAIEIQRHLAHRNTDVPPDRRIELKIAIHIGEVVHRSGDVYGDGVNIASRIEPLAGVSANNMALMFLGLGEKEKAIDALERSYREGAGNDIYCIRVDPMVDELRNDSHFEALAEKIVPARQFKSTTASE